MFELSLGSKVFLLGEYQVLQEGTAFLAILEPRFKLVVKEGIGRLGGIPTESPASKYHQQNQEFFKEWDLDFLDPHQGAGGFGASTAQIGLLQGLKEGYEAIRTHSQVEFDLKKIHRKYLELVQPEQGPSPSGADLLSQFQGGLIELNIQSGRIQKQAWPFADIQVYFFRTGKKQATHEHLKKIKIKNKHYLSEESSNQSHLEDPGQSVDDLVMVYNKAIESFHHCDRDLFTQSIQDYHKELDKRGWVAPETMDWLSKVQKLNGVLAAKGCGAMGADVIAVVAKKDCADDVILGGESLGLQFVGNLDQRTEGFTYRWEEL